jgi:hypothetical protein
MAALATTTKKATAPATSPAPTLGVAPATEQAILTPTDTPTDITAPVLRATKGICIVIQITSVNMTNEVRRGSGTNT